MAVAEGDARRRRLELLFAEHRVAVFRYASRRAPAGVVDDVVAETFLVAWRRLETLPADPLPWLLGVARRVVATQLRSSRRQAALAEKLAGATADAPWAPAIAPALEDRPVIEALARLRPGEREAIMLVAWEGLTPAQAAAVLGHSTVAFRVRLHRARRRLDAELAGPAARAVAPLPKLVEEGEC
jgi:RNA polymerase sigma-70 factor (ECF subfamily)